MKHILTIFITIILLSATAYAATPVLIPSGNGTVADVANNLIWLKDANCYGALDYSIATFRIQDLGYKNCGLTDHSNDTDWRLPTVAELQNFTSNGLMAGTLNAAGFNNVQGEHYRTSNAIDWYRMTFQGVDMSNGHLQALQYADKHYVWPVRSIAALAWEPQGLTISIIGSGTGTVTPSTGTITWTGPTGTGYYKKENVTLTATANSGSKFTSWNGCDNVSGLTCTVGVPGGSYSISARNVTATFSENQSPILTSFTIPTTSNTLTVPITTLTATDNLAVTRYKITETSAPPLSGSTGWTAAAPASYTFASIGNKTLYAWAKDAAGNISLPLSADVTVTVPVNGACGSSNGTVPTVPTTNLCSAGTPTTVTGTGPWTWSCSGLNSGSTASCSATLDLGSCSPGLSGLIGWWPGDGNANDISGSANTGTISGSVSYQAGKIGQAFNFPGNSSSYVSTATPLTAISDNFSMVMWVKPNATRNATTESNSGFAGTSGQQYAIMPVSGGATTAGTGVSVGTNGISVFEHGNSYLPSLLVYNAAIAGWNHVAVVYENKTPRLYVNGVMVRQGIKSGKIVSPSAIFGGGNTYGPYNGMLDEVQIFNRVLTVGEIQSNYSAAAGTCKPVAGSCGAANGTTIPSAPVSNVCSTGTASTISGNGPWNWSCNGLNGGSTASCSANIQTYTVTSGVVGGNGTVNCTSPVVYGANSICSAAANSGYQLATFTDNSVDKKSSVAGGSYTISTVTANHTIAATFGLIPTTPVNGACGTASGTTVATVPTSGFCSTGNASVISGTGPWSWTCAGSGGGTSANCQTNPADSTRPTLTLSTLADGSITNNATLNISGTVTDSSDIKSLTVNNQPVTVAGNGSFTYPVTLVSGANTITTIATDNADNQTTDSRIITLDVTAPLLTISAPADNSKTAQVLATVTGTIDTTSTVTVKINSGTPQNAAISGNSYSATINLAAGINTITVKATDLAGNTTSVVRSVIYDNTNPSIAITNPSQDITTDQNSITITGTVSDTITTATVKITFNSQNYSPTITGGTFSQLLTIPTAGTYAVVATATDEAGNSSSATRNLIYQKSGIVVPSPGKTRPNLADAMRVLNIAMGITTPTAADYAQGDIAPLDSNAKPKGNGVIDTYDAIGILRMVAGLL